mmetsp:Transcript_3440/g.9967  ORF Transcript_3440/g.9967 Transcript_3440/m.9967 type:complete len:384 (-) Transcript_3440:349-1500(-)|eukprot:CAMPEP_0206135088 /NCGR_PEP_ID=MMETSP1473-20131121/449_1 /ASSEMBLY_ACC=CAM_ASM_001109 /TAXON_ID=1461547 /ORGANISM="Stichococcus sp, Strain RCC1054" /LENGTH=383 /DNA_ID=CAMNT_0053526811 /DNA_START=146 /DNA_END=1297 /DNA_ORIENTATION=+
MLQSCSGMQCAGITQPQLYDRNRSIAPQRLQQRRRWCLAQAEEEKKSKGLFNFVTDNASSRASVYVPEQELNGAEMGSVARRTEKKGKDFGKWWGIRATGSDKRGTLTEIDWFIREIGDGKSDANSPPTLFLHGIPSQSYSFLEVLKRLDDRNWHAYAADWVGFGYSDAPTPKFGFDYTEDEFHKALDNMLDDKDIKRPFNLVAHGYVTGQYAATWALKHPKSVAKLVLIGMPLNKEAKLPPRLVPLRIPLANAIACQDALIAERTLEGGSPYEMDLDDADVYRYPYLTGSRKGKALMETVKQADLAGLGARLTQGLSEAAGWKVPTLLLTGDSDKYVKAEVAENIAAGNSSVITASEIEASGHQPQEDYPQLVTQALVSFLE